MSIFEIKKPLSKFIIIILFVKSLKYIYLVIKSQLFEYKVRNVLYFEVKTIPLRKKTSSKIFEYKISLFRYFSLYKIIGYLLINQLIKLTKIIKNCLSLIYSLIFAIFYSQILFKLKQNKT